MHFLCAHVKCFPCSLCCATEVCCLLFVNCDVLSASPKIDAIKYAQMNLHHFCQFVTVTLSSQHSRASLDTKDCLILLNSFVLKCFSSRDFHRSADCFCCHFIQVFLKRFEDSSTEIYALINQILMTHSSRIQLQQIEIFHTVRFYELTFSCFISSKSSTKNIDDDDDSVASVRIIRATSVSWLALQISESYFRHTHKLRNDVDQGLFLMKRSSIALRLASGIETFVQSLCLDNYLN